MKKYTVVGIGILAAGVTIAACTKNLGDQNAFGNYDQQGLLTNISNAVLVPEINSLADSATACSSAINAFAADPTSTTLSAAQAAWAQLTHAWAMVAPFNFGPMNTHSWSAQIDTWPIKSAKIETAVGAQAGAAAQGADAKGLKALEYLLFDSTGAASMLEKYQGSSADAVNRRAYLVSVAQNVTDITVSLQDAWSGSAGYAATFINAKSNDVSSAVSLLVNTTALYLDQVKNMKIGNPIGMGVKVNDNQLHPSMIEYTLTEQSIQTMLLNVQSMKLAFDGGTGQGLDDLLDYMQAKKNGENLSVVVDSSFDAVITQLQGITPPYATALGSQTQQLKNIYNSLKALIAYFKVDVANNLGVTITFADTDGD